MDNGPHGYHHLTDRWKLRRSIPFKKTNIVCRDGATLLETHRYYVRHNGCISTPTTTEIICLSLKWSWGTFQTDDTFLENPVIWGTIELVLCQFNGKYCLEHSTEVRGRFIENSQLCIDQYTGEIMCGSSNDTVYFCRSASVYFLLCVLSSLLVDWASNGYCCQSCS